MCEGLDPNTGDRLTLRKNTSRRTVEQKTVANRRVFYDFTISPPKSVSVVGLLQDGRILDLHDRAVRQAMAELEKFAETRVRKSGQEKNRETGNIVTTTFRHDTSRELDPHLHTHCVVLNATFDPVEQHWKALQVEGMYRAQKYVENVYYHELARGLRGIGYATENTKNGFEVRGVPKEVIVRFSKRHQQIDAEAAKCVEEGRVAGNLKDVREQIARDARKRKIKGATADQLRPYWMQQLSDDERSTLAGAGGLPRTPGQRIDAAEAVAWADEHLFERRSVVNDHELMSAALAHACGHEFEVAALRDAVERRGYTREAGSRKLTSPEVLRCELQVVLAAHDGRRKHLPLTRDYRPSETLSVEQRGAAATILGSRDFITLFRGGAGTGKSFTLKEVERGLVAAGHSVVVLAPQRQQVNDLRSDGLPAETLSHFLQAKQLPRGAVVMVDEAGQIGARQLRNLIGIVQANAGRLILSGDTRQHGAVAASDALRAIEKHACLKPAEIRTIRRQDPSRAESAVERAFIRGYRAAVKAAATGDISSSFDRLDRLGCIRELDAANRHQALAAEYLAAIDRKERALVVAQTREEARVVNESIRARLAAAGRLAAGTPVTTYQMLDLSEAQKRDRRFIEAGRHVHFLQRYGRFAKGDVVEIAGTTERGIVLIKGGRRSTMSFRYANRIAMVAVSEMEIAAGDRLQLKFNGRSREGVPLNNGEIVTVRRLNRNGSIVVDGDDGVRKTLEPSQRMFVRGYAVTSYGSQGKTVDTVILSDASNRAATNANQWYVTISRGRKRVVIFTPDKAALCANIERAGDRELALDLKASTPGIRARMPAWTRRALATIERHRLHQLSMERVGGHRQRNHFAA